MTTSHSSLDEENGFSHLRREAERLLKQGAPSQSTFESLSEAIHELEVHHIELELQNQELRKAQQQLEVSQEEFFDLFDNAPVGYFTFDDHGCVTRVNLTGSTQLNTDRKALLRSPFTSYIDAKDRQAFREHLSTVLKTHQRQTLEVQLHPQDLPRFYGRLYSISFTTPNGIAQCRSALIDITPQIQTKRSLEALQHDLQRKVEERTHDLQQTTNELVAVNNELESFSYSVAHDLRAPLRSLSGFSQILSEDYESYLDEEGKDLLKRIQQSANAMSNLIDDILRMSRISRTELQCQSVDMSALAARILEDLQNISQPRSVELHITPELIANADVKLVEILLKNLLSNAWKFTGKNKTTVITFGATRRDGTTTYFIQDNGTGFDEKYSGKLFVPFQRLHSQKDYAGTGIGLAIAKRVVNRHGGKIWAESEVGKGATFYFTLADSHAHGNLTRDRT